MATDRHPTREYMRTFLWDLPPVHALYIPSDVLYSKQCRSVTSMHISVKNIDCQNRTEMQNPIRQLRVAVCILHAKYRIYCSCPQLFSLQTLASLVCQATSPESAPQRAS